MGKEKTRFTESRDDDNDDGEDKGLMSYDVVKWCCFCR